jgi:hypothetical protein
MYEARYENYSARERTAAERKRIADGHFNTFSKEHSAANPGESLTSAFAAFKAKYPTLAEDYARPVDFSAAQRYTHETKGRQEPDQAGHRLSPWERPRDDLEAWVAKYLRAHPRADYFLAVHEFLKARDMVTA